MWQQYTNERRRRFKACFESCMQHGCTLNDRLLPVPSQLPLLRKRWKQVVFGALFQYCHGLATQLAHRMHRPMAQPLHDVGFALLPVRL